MSYETLAINLRRVFLCAREPVTRMIEQGGSGRVVLISSMNALHFERGPRDASPPRTLGYVQIA
jgi:NAD(P)-dependent dehydrogenase (short-subunit alcohol dehydrogenase family)